MDLRQPLLSDELVRNHISGCDRCAELVIDFGALNDSLSQIPLSTLQRLSGLQESEFETVEPRSRMHPFSFIGSIACVLLVMLTSGIWFSGQAEQSAHESPVAQNVELASEQIASEESLGAESFHSGDDREPYASQVLHQLAFVSNHSAPSPAEFINTASLEQISGRVEPFQGYLGMTADLPGIGPVSNSFNATLQLFKSISEKQSAPKKRKNDDAPDVGWNDDAALQICCA
ncbi:hypothetical protein [Mariniblastus fucicola]|nr:hypothetical protein [Mariniblastus fucicola]